MTMPLRVVGPEAEPRSFDPSRPVMLVGFLQQGNLGLGYLSASLREQGYRVEVVDFEQDPEQILAVARRADPVLIGFSLIFQFYVRRFGALARYLRENGVSCHFTIGGHFPSLSDGHTLDLIPELDSVVRFEGEETLVDLVDRLGTGREWRDAPGISYRRGEEVVANALRPLIHDLDVLPHPDRNFQPESVLGRLAMPLIASRGCARTCSFCSIHTFYRAVPGKIVRIRQPQRVAEEMRMLHEERGITIFLFQDDDFPLFGPAWRKWTREFLGELHRLDLPRRVIWKINCRADAVEPELFALMKQAGLYMVYMGLESGSEEGLVTLNKEITVEQNLRAVDVLKGLGLTFEFGFMMFDPSSTFGSIRENVGFLRSIVGDGSAAAVFCRMLPYDGTAIKTQLEREGRLRGDVCDPDYDFLDPRLGDLYEDLSRLIHVTGWIHGYRALSPQLNWAWNELAVIERLFPPAADVGGYKRRLRAITRASNELLFRLVEDYSAAYAGDRRPAWSERELEERCHGFLDRLLETRNAFVAANQEAMLEALERPSCAASA